MAIKLFKSVTQRATQETQRATKNILRETLCLLCDLRVMNSASIR